MALWSDSDVTEAMEKDLVRMRIALGTVNSHDINSTSQKAERRARYGTSWPILWPVAVLVVMSFIIRVFDVDRMISSRCYNAVNHVWPCERADPWLSFYRYGVYPPLLLGIASVISAIWARRIWSKMDLVEVQLIRLRSAFLCLLLLIGPGLLINGGLKSVWGRPRPLQCQEFGGDQTFRHVGEWTLQKFPNSSFPSGHASIAFFMMAPAFIMRSSEIWGRRLWMCGGLAYGLAMGFTRVLQGGHFLSDVLWAGMIVYLVGVGLSRWMFPVNDVAQINLEQKAAA